MPKFLSNEAVNGRSPLGRKLPALVAPFIFFLVFSLLAGSFLTIPAYAAGFSDTKGHWAEAAIEQASAAGYINGYPDGTFRPNQGVTRAEFITILNSAFNVPKSPNTSLSFKDVSAKDWFAEGVRTAVAAGYVGGYPDGTFRPQQAVTRQEAAAFLARLLKLESDVSFRFTDASKIDSWARPAVAALVEKGVMSGYPDGSFGPKRTITRAEAAVVVNSARSLSASSPVTVYLLVTGKVVNIRSGPGTSYDIIGQVEEGDVLKAVEKSNGWYRVEFQGKAGWIAGWLVEVYNTKPPARGEPGTLDVRYRQEDRGVVVTLTGGPDTDYSWDESSNPQRLVVTVPGVTVVRTPMEISVNAGGLKEVTTRLQSGSAEVTLTFDGGSTPVYYRVEKGSAGVLQITVPYQINSVEAENAGDGVDITLGGTAPLSYNTFRLSDPRRIVFDFSGFTLAGSLLHWEKQLSQEGFTEARLSQFRDGVVRLVVEVTQGVTFTEERRSNGREITLKFRPASLVSRVVVIDPGHGGSDPGAIGPDGVKEKDVNLAIAGKVAEILRQQGVNILLTRPGDGDAGLVERAQLANSNNAEVFVSIHSNSSTNSGMGGTATYTYAPAGTPLGLQRESRLRLARLLQEELVQALGLRDAGVFEENFSVLRNTSMPAALVEVAFLSNPVEEQLLASPGFQDRAARAIARAITRYLTE